MVGARSSARFRAPGHQDSPPLRAAWPSGEPRDRPRGFTPAADREAGPLARAEMSPASSRNSTLFPVAYRRRARPHLAIKLSGPALAERDLDP